MKYRLFLMNSWNICVLQIFCLCSYFLNNRCRKHGTQIKQKQLFVALVSDIYVMFTLSLLYVTQPLALTETLLVRTAWLGGDSAIRWQTVEEVLTYSLNCPTSHKLRTRFKTVGPIWNKMTQYWQHFATFRP